MNSSDLRELVDKAERIGVIGSPSSTTEIKIDILGYAADKRLVGELALFSYLQDGSSHYALGQINEITMQNIFHENPAMRGLVRQRGPVEGISERQDTHQGEMIVSAVFTGKGDRYDSSILGTVPGTNTHISLANDEVLDGLLEKYKENIFYLGNVYGSTPKLPLWFKHFDTGEDGLGEAYHIGIFGKTGSGKSVLAKMILLAYARHKEMGLFVLDPEGQFAKGLHNASTDIPSMEQILSEQTLNHLGRDFEVFGLSQIRLETQELFGQLLSEIGFFSDLGIKYASYDEQATDEIIHFLKQNWKKYRLENLNDQAFYDVLDYLFNNIARIYARPDGQQRVRNLINGVRKQRDSSITKQKWDRIKPFFSGGGDKKSTSEVVTKALTQGDSRPLVIIDLSIKPPTVSIPEWEGKIKPLLIDSFISTLESEGRNAYKDDQSLNTLVVLDEAQRLAPRGKIENERKDRIKHRLIDAAQTTRKYGLGWMFISLSLSSLDRAIVESGVRTYFFGFGLGVGAEFRTLRDLVGGQGKSLDLYRRFRDPGSSFDISSREYSFMAHGPVSPLSATGAPLFFNAFTKPDDFLQVNDLTPDDEDTPDDDIPF